MFVHSKLGRTALYGMTKDNTVEDIRMAASEALGEPVLGISNDGRILDGTLTVADIMVGDTMAEILIAVVGEVRHKENKGHLSGPLVALSLPRSAGDAGISLIVDHGGMEKAKGDPRIVRMFRVRRDHVHGVLELLLRHNKYYRSLYREIDEEALNRLPLEGIPEDLPILIEDRSAGEKLPGG